MPPQPPMPSPAQLKPLADKQAEPLLQKLKTNPKDTAVLAELGNLYFDAQDFARAIGYYEKVLKLAPKNVTVRTDMAPSEKSARIPSVTGPSSLGVISA